MHINMQVLIIILSILLLGSVSAAPVISTAPVVSAAPVAPLPSPLSPLQTPTNKGASVTQPTPPAKRPGDGRKEDPAVQVVKSFHIFLDQYMTAQENKEISDPKSKGRGRAFLKTIGYDKFKKMSPEQREMALKKYQDHFNQQVGRDLAFETMFMHDFVIKLQDNIVKKQGKPNARLEKFIKSPVFADKNMQPALEVRKRAVPPAERPASTPLTEEQRQILARKSAEGAHRHVSLKRAAQSVDHSKPGQHDHISNVPEHVELSEKSQIKDDADRNPLDPQSTRSETKPADEMPASLMMQKRAEDSDCHYVLTDGPNVPIWRPKCTPKDPEDVVGGQGKHANHTGATEMAERRENEDGKERTSWIGPRLIWYNPLSRNRLLRDRNGTKEEPNTAGLRNHSRRQSGVRQSATTDGASEHADVESEGPVRRLKRWVRHRLTWTNVERPTIPKVNAAAAAAVAPSPAPDAAASVPVVSLGRTALELDTT